MVKIKVLCFHFLTSFIVLRAQEDDDDQEIVPYDVDALEERIFSGLSDSSKEYFETSSRYDDESYERKLQEIRDSMDQSNSHAEELREEQSTTRERIKREVDAETAVNNELEAEREEFQTGSFLEES